GTPDAGDDRDRDGDDQRAGAADDEQSQRQHHIAGEEAGHRARTITAGVYQVENRSMKAWVFAFASWASSTRWMIRASVVSAPTPVARTWRKPPRETVPANTWSLTVFSTGMDSPVIDASSTAPVPAMI